MTAVAGASVFGGALAVGTGALSQITDADSGPSADAGGRGRGPRSSVPTGRTDSDSGTNADRGGYGRGSARAGGGSGGARGCTTQTGRSDTDSGANADRGGYGRTGLTDSDSGSYADRSGCGRGSRRPMRPPLQNPGGVTRPTMPGQETMRDPLNPQPLPPNPPPNQTPLNPQPLPPGPPPDLQVPGAAAPKRWR